MCKKPDPKWNILNAIALSDAQSHLIVNLEYGSLAINDLQTYQQGCFVSSLKIIITIIYWTLIMYQAICLAFYLHYII